MYLAIDIGASSGRHIAGWMEDGVLKTEEVYRFPNGVTQQDGHLIWDIESLLASVKEGIRIAREKYPIDSIAIDTWGCDYVLLNGDTPIPPCYAYRDDRTAEAVEKLHSIVPFETLYAHTGSQFQPFNTLYQLYADHLTGRLDRATDFLMVPEYLLYRLTGSKVKEYTNATTTGMIAASTGAFDVEIIRALGLPEQLFPALAQPGTITGTYEGIPCLLCATHDTASAVEGIPMEGNEPYISSGTWSLLGLKTPRPLTDDKSMAGNWSNEGGIQYNRYQKNIMGMWLINRLRDDLCPGEDFGAIVRAAEESRFDETVNADDHAFLAPRSMKAAFDEALEAKPAAMGDYFRCAYRSLAESYAKAIRELSANTGRSMHSLYIVGGGAKNAFLNRLTEEATGLKVIALPIEATALGNLKIQSEVIK